MELWHTDPDIGQVKVYLEQAGICGSQLQEVRGEKGGPMPHLLGHEGVGRVSEIGPGVTKVQVGDRVILHWMKGDGIEAPVLPSYDTSCKKEDCIRVGAGHITTFNELALVSENRCTVISDDVPADLACLLSCALSTSLGVCENEAKLKMGESVLVVGCGGVGLCCIAAAAAMRCLVWAIDHTDKSDLAIKAGCHRFTTNALDLLDVGEFDCIIETTGQPRVITNMIPRLKGRMVLVGQPKPDEEITIPVARRLWEGTGKRIIATQGGRCIPNIDIPRWIKAWRRGHLKIEGIVTNYFKIDEINEALDLLRSGTAGRIMIKM